VELISATADLATMMDITWDVSPRRRHPGTPALVREFVECRANRKSFHLPPGAGKLFPLKFAIKDASYCLALIHIWAIAGGSDYKSQDTGDRLSSGVGEWYLKETLPSWPWPT
jgi:hypothetical protein